jgi:hypothetical protein
VSSIERAKFFMQRKARVIALTAVPLASLIATTAPSAKAGLILDPGGTDACAVTAVLPGGVSGGYSGGCTVSQLSAGSSLTGVTMAGYGFVETDTGGGTEAVVFTVAGGTTNGGGLSGVVVPIAYAFTITDSDPGALFYSITCRPTVHQFLIAGSFPPLQAVSFRAPWTQAP